MNLEVEGLSFFLKSECKNELNIGKWMKDKFILECLFAFCKILDRDCIINISIIYKSAYDYKNAFGKKTFPKKKHTPIKKQVK